MSRLVGYASFRRGGVDPTRPGSRWLNDNLTKVDEYGRPWVVPTNALPAHDPAAILVERTAVTLQARHRASSW